MLGQVLVVYALLVVVSILCVFYVILRRPKLSVQMSVQKAGDRSPQSWGSVGAFACSLDSVHNIM